MEKRSTKFYRKNEAEVMEALGLRPTKNSGAGWIEKEDGQNEFVIAQLKTTDKMSMSLKLEDLNTLEYNAAVSHKIPMFVVQYLYNNNIYILVKPEDLCEIVNYIKTGKCEINKVLDVENSTTEELKIKPQKVIGSGNRKRFWSEKEKERENWKRSK